MAEVPAIVFDSILQFASHLFVGPVWPASILVCLLAIYTLLALIGLVDLDVDMPDIETPDIETLDVDTNVDLDALQGIGAATVRWTNFGRVPVVIWGGIFTLGFWIVSYLLWHQFDVRRYEPTLLASTLLCLRNLVIATGIAKVCTEPMVKHFVAAPAYDQTRLIGATCEIVSVEATPDYGQARFRTDAAPLLLNVRTDGPHIDKGKEVRIVAFDSKTRVYQVTNLPSEASS